VYKPAQDCETCLPQAKRLRWY